MQYSNTAYLLTGSNIGDKSAHLGQAASMIAGCCGTVSRLSPVYQTAAWGKEDQAAFLNQALELRTDYGAEALMQALLQLEEKMGRIRTGRYGPRLIDIDILLFNQETISTALVTIPHPELQNRRFALQPLADIAATVRHPLFHKSVAELLADCTDRLVVERMKANTSSL